MIEKAGEYLLIGDGEAGDPAAYGGALARARELGLPLIVAPVASGVIGTPMTPAPAGAAGSAATPAPEVVQLTPQQASDHATYMAALSRARAAGQDVVVQRPAAIRQQDVQLSREQAANHQLWLAAQEKATKQGGVVVVKP